MVAPLLCAKTASVIDGVSQNVAYARLAARDHRLLQRHFERLRRVTSRDARDTDDARQTALVVALELQRERGAPVDWENPEESKTFWTRVAREWRRWRAGFASRSLDAPQRFPGSYGPAPVELLQAPESADPLKRLLELQSATEGQALLERAKRDTYSQFAAYVIALERLTSTAPHSPRISRLRAQRLWGGCCDRGPSSTLSLRSSIALCASLLISSRDAVARGRRAKPATRRRPSARSFACLSLTRWLVWLRRLGSLAA
jgi:hypothetical protein